MTTVRSGSSHSSGGCSRSAPAPRGTPMMGVKLDGLSAEPVQAGHREGGGRGG